MLGSLKEGAGYHATIEGMFFLVYSHVGAWSHSLFGCSQ